MFITDIELGAVYSYKRSDIQPVRVVVIRTDSIIGGAEKERHTVYVQAVGSPHRWVAMPHELHIIYPVCIGCGGARVVPPETQCCDCQVMQQLSVIKLWYKPGSGEPV